MPDDRTEVRTTPAVGHRGMMIVVVGPSGAGKDTLMALAADHFAGHDAVHFVRRVITRPSDAGSEDHDSLSPADFDARRRAGGFAVSWEAHGLKYGIPAETCQRTAGGQIVIANGSRSALLHFQKAFPHLRVLNITASLAVLAERLQARGRESREDILRRLERSSLDVKGDFDVVTVDNSGAIAVAAAEVIAAIETALRDLPEAHSAPGH